jgi:hypothetical protein
LEAYDTGYALPGFTLRPVDPALFYEPATLNRLRRLHEKIDPDSLFVVGGPG